MAGAEDDNSKKKFNKYYKKLEDIFGKSNLNENKLDMGFINTTLKETTTKQVMAQEDKSKKFMSAEGITLTAKDVQFNMSNNLDNKFFLEGELELCDYYNYGYTNESKFFCGQVTPDDGSDSWYLYFNREAFSNFYDRLINGQTGHVRVFAKIPSSVYENGQGNMAVVTRAQGGR